MAYNRNSQSYKIFLNEADKMATSGAMGDVDWLKNLMSKTSTWDAIGMAGLPSVSDAELRARQFQTQINQAQIYQEQVNQAYGAQQQERWQHMLGLAQGVQNPLPVSGPARVTPPLGERAREMFLKRMGGIRSEMKLAAQDFLMCHIYNDEVFVFYLLGGKEGVVHEGIDLFPSDTLITQFRIILA